MMKRIVCAALALVMCAVCLALGSFAEDAGKAVAGKAPRSVFTLAEGADVACYALDGSSPFGAAEFSVLTFDVTRDDLLLNIVRGGAANEGRAIASVRANDEARFALDGGAVALASKEAVPSFGVSASGEALVGELGASVELRDRDTARTVIADSVNRDGRIALYTKDFASIPADEYRVAIDVQTDGLLVPGVPVRGVVISEAGPGEALRTYGSAVVAGDGAVLADFAPGDRLTLTADVADASGNSAAWRTVVCSVGGSAMLLKDGKAIAAHGEPAASNVIGVRADGKAVIISFAKGADGMDAASVAALCDQLGMKDAFAVSDDCVIELTALDESDSGVSASELGEIAKEITSIDWMAKHMKAETAVKAHAVVPTPASTDGAADNAAEVQSGLPDAAWTSDGYEQKTALYKQIEFDSTGEWLTLVINESDVEAWYGKIY